MTNHAVSLHLSEPQSAVSASAFGGLSSQELGWASASRVHLLSDHVLESLVVSRAEEDENVEHFASETVVHSLVAVSLVAQLVQLTGDLGDLLATEWSGVSNAPVESRLLGKKAFDQVANSHSGRNSVRVDDEIWSDAFSSER